MKKRHGTSTRIAVFAGLSLVAAMTFAALAGSAGAAAGGNLRYSTRPAPGAGGALGAAGQRIFASPSTRVGTNVNVTNGGEPQSETTIAVDPTNPRHVIASVNDKLNTFSATNNVYESFNLGQTWTNANLLPGTFCYDTWADFNAAGDVFVSYECGDERIAYKLHGSSTWVKTTFSSTLAGSAPDRDMVVVDTNPSSPFFNSVYVGYDDNGSGNKAYVLYSRDGKTGWARSPKINDSTTGTIGVNVSVGPDGTIYASWLDYSSKKLMMDVSHDGGVTWGTDKLVHTYRANTTTFFISIPPQNVRGIVPFPLTVASPAGTTHAGRLYESYEDIGTTGTDFNIYSTYSDDGGTTWSPEAQVNDDTVHATQFFPAINVARNGTVGLSFYDTRNDQPANHKTDRYVSFSTDGGATWGANIKITSAQTDETTGSFNSNQYGDYEGQDAAPNGLFFEVWTDHRTGTTNEDMFTAIVKP